MVRVLEQHRTLLSDPLGGVGARERIHDAAAGRVVDDARGERGTDDAAHHVVDAAHGHLSRLDGLLQRVAEPRPFGRTSRLLGVQACQRRLRGAVRGVPVGDDESLEAPGLLQQLVEQVVVLAGPVAVHLVVGAHDHAGLALQHGDLEGEQVGLAHDARAHLHVADVAPGLLIVDGVVLEISDDLLALLALDHLGHHLAGEDRIFSEILEVPSVARLAHQVDAATERGVVPADRGARDRSGRRTRGPVPCPTRRPRQSSMAAAWRSVRARPRRARRRRHRPTGWGATRVAARPG